MTGLLERLGWRAPAPRRCLPRDVAITVGTSPLGATVRWWWCSHCDTGGYVIDRPRRDAVDAARAHLLGRLIVCRPLVHRVPDSTWWGLPAWTWTCPRHPNANVGYSIGNGPERLAWVGPTVAWRDAFRHALEHETRLDAPGDPS